MNIERTPKSDKPLTYNIERAPKSEKPMTYDEAVLYCQFLEYKGHRDWRMPTHHEWKVLGLYGWWTDRMELSAISKRRVIPVRDV